MEGLLHVLLCDGQGYKVGGILPAIEQEDDHAAEGAKDGHHQGRRHDDLDQRVAGDVSKEGAESEAAFHAARGRGASERG